MTGMADRSNYYEVPRGARLLACLGCAAVILDDPAAREPHGLLHEHRLDRDRPPVADEA